MCIMVCVGTTVQPSAPVSLSPKPSEDVPSGAITLLGRALWASRQGRHRGQGQEQEVRMAPDGCEGGRNQESCDRGTTDSPAYSLSSPQWWFENIQLMHNGLHWHSSLASNRKSARVSTLAMHYWISILGNNKGRAKRYQNNFLHGVEHHNQCKGTKLEWNGYLRRLVIVTIHLEVDQTNSWVIDAKTPVQHSSPLKKRGLISYTGSCFCQVQLKPFFVPWWLSGCL